MAGLSAYKCCKRSMLYEALERSIVYTESKVYQLLVKSVEPVVIPKYRYPGDGLLYSRVTRTRLERIVWNYTPIEMKRHATRTDNCLGGPVPRPESSSALVCDPRCRREELLTEPRDDLELLAAELLALLEANGVKAYPTGSLLGYYQDPLYSDVDLVIYLDETPCSRAVETLHSILDEPPRGAKIAWAVAKGVESSLYRRYIWGVYRGRRVSIVYALAQRRACEAIYVYNPSRVIKARLWVEPGQCQALLWPHTVLGVEETGYVKAIVSFDGVYAPLLYEGGILVVEGVYGYIEAPRGRIEAIILGLSEKRGSITPVQTP